MRDGDGEGDGMGLILAGRRFVATVIDRVIIVAARMAKIASRSRSVMALLERK